MKCIRLAYDYFPFGSTMIHIEAYEAFHRLAREENPFYESRKRWYGSWTPTRMWVGLDLGDIFSIPHSSKWISSWLSEIISNMSLVILLRCRIDGSTGKKSLNSFTVRSDLPENLSFLTFTGCCFERCKYSLVIITCRENIQLQRHRWIILDRITNTLTHENERDQASDHVRHRKRICQWNSATSPQLLAELEEVFVWDHIAHREFSWENRHESKFVLRRESRVPRALSTVAEGRSIAEKESISMMISTTVRRDPQARMSSPPQMKGFVTWSVEYSSVRYHVMPRLAKRLWIACWMVCEVLQVDRTVDV